MAKYRHDLPQMRGGTFLSDGGMETALIFLDGIDLPYFASFPLVETEDGRAALELDHDARVEQTALPVPALRRLHGHVAAADPFGPSPERFRQAVDLGLERL